MSDYRHPISDQKSERLFEHTVNLTHKLNFVVSRGGIRL